MRLANFFLIPMGFFVLLWGFCTPHMSQRPTSSQNDEVGAQLKVIDNQIQELEDMKRGYEARALRHEDQAERLQFQNQNYLEARRHMQLADENRQAAAEIQKEIDRLKEQRERLIQRSVKGGPDFEDL